MSQIIAASAGRGHASRSAALRWRKRRASPWLRKFGLPKKPYPEGLCDRPSGPKVVSVQSLPSRDREGAVQGLFAYDRS